MERGLVLYHECLGGGVVTCPGETLLLATLTQFLPSTLARVKLVSLDLTPELPLILCK